MSWSRLQQGAETLFSLVHNEGLRFLKLADIVLILINPSPCYVKWVNTCHGRRSKKIIFSLNHPELLLFHYFCNLLQHQKRNHILPSSTNT